MRDATRLPRWLIIVRRDKPMLYQHLHDSYEGDGRVEVILDRRRAAPTEMPPGAEWRRGERRVRDRRANPAGDRRQVVRRQPLASPQQGFWGTEGFFMVRRGTDPSA
jgi:hypothetical protein